MLHHLRLATLATAVLFGSVACGTDGPTGPSRPGGAAGQAAAECDPDITAPTITSLSASPNVLWPPNHKMVRVDLAAAADDACAADGAITWRVVSVSSSEPADWLGDGHFQPDWQVTGSTPPMTVLLRAERSGLLGGRTYTITVTATDAANNVATSATTVFVPHDQD
jgi:hypothetical protein